MMLRKIRTKCLKGIGKLVSYLRKMRVLEGRGLDRVYGLVRKLTSYLGYEPTITCEIKDLLKSYRLTGCVFTREDILGELKESMRRELGTCLESLCKRGFLFEHKGLYSFSKRKIRQIKAMEELLGLLFN
jgi:hypothetical protein